MKKLLLCILISASLTGCSVVTENEYPVGKPYVSTNVNKIEIARPTVEFEQDVIIISPNILSYFTEYQKARVSETIVDKETTIKHHIINGVTSTVLFGLPILLSASDEFTMYPCDGALTAKGKPELNTVKCVTTISDKGIKETALREISKKTYYDNSNLIVTIKSDKGEISLPLSKDNKIYTSLEELNNPDEFTIIVSYGDESEAYDIDVPAISKYIQKSVKKDGFVISNIRNKGNVLNDYPEDERLSEKATFKNINHLFDESIERYITTVQEPKIPELKVFPEIPEPKLPPAPVLDKSQFETKSEFQKRVQMALDERNKTIENIQIEYRRKVDKRNAELKLYLTFREKEVTKLIDGYNSRKGQINNNIEKAKVKQTAYAFKKVLGNPYIDELNYDAETQTLYGVIKMTLSEYQEKVSIQVPSKDARTIFEDKGNVGVSISYQIVNEKVELEQISIKKGDTSYLAKIDNTEYKADDTRVVINTDKKLNNVEQLKATDLMLGETSLLQNPSLTDEYSISAITFVRNKELQVGEKAFNDDIPTLLKNAKQRTISKKRWLFVVGIENYQQTDNVQYSRRSAELFVQVAQKKLGISKRNTYSLIDEQATVGQIKDKMRLMLKNVNKGDEIYFYYNGHGIPDPQDDNQPYLLASDKIPDFVTDDPYFKLENFYQQLTNSKADKVVAFVDSCFSGATDGISIIKGVAASRLAPKQVSFDQNKMVVMSAGTKKQYSNVYLDKGNRLFSYFVMKELLNNERQVSAIYKDVRKNVRETSLDMGDLKLQEPSLSGNQSLSF